MTLLLIVAAVTAWWYWGRDLTRQQLVAAASALIGGWLLLKGNWQLAMPMFLPGIWMLVQSGQGGAASTAPPTSSPSMDIEEARRILGVTASADAEEIRAAHRRLVSRVHPDQGGSTELATRVNAARDLLLAEQGRV